MTFASAALFILAGIAEIGGGYLIWLWLREGRSVVMGVAGLLVLGIYGVLPTFQPASFGRTYAAYGGLFIVLSLAWGWLFQKQRPDVPDLVGACLCLAGASVIMYWRR